MTRPFVFLFILLIYSGLLVAQVKPGQITMDSLQAAELRMKVLVDSMTRGSNDLVKQAALAEFNPLFFDLLRFPESFNYPFDSLKAISKVKSDDGRMRLITWTVQSRIDGTYQYFGVVQDYDLKSGELRRKGLKELKKTNDEAEAAGLLADEWYPALYYEIIEKKYKKETRYFLLGWQGNDGFTSRKIIDVLVFDEWHNISFGLPVFIDEDKKKKNRIVFEYSAQAVMMLKYNQKKKMIVFDHLSPASPSARGQYRFYGPDFTYDGFRYKKGVWNYRTNLDLRNQR